MAGMLLAFGIAFAGCGAGQTAMDNTAAEETQADRIVVGFSQLGA